MINCNKANSMERSNADGFLFQAFLVKGKTGIELFNLNFNKQHNG